MERNGFSETRQRGPAMSTLGRTTRSSSIQIRVVAQTRPPLGSETDLERDLIWRPVCDERSLLGGAAANPFPKPVHRH
jgi:hypothetical protein